MNLGPIFHPTRLTCDAARDDGARDAGTRDCGGGELGVLPEWDLSDLYPAMDSPELTGDLERVEVVLSE